MKGKLLLAIAMFPFISYGQSINVNTNSYSIPQLVNDILINSTCVEASNITWRTGSNFGSVNGMGYFTNTNAGFPISSGIILSTGEALAAAGPNTSVQNAGTSQWIGDNSTSFGQWLPEFQPNSKNATILEFDFIPISNKFHFDFVFASEDYGISQCSPSDAVAFLLTNWNTGETTNIAIVNGTDSLISANSIRDNAYNSSCLSYNSMFFGSYNGGAVAATSATNFNGNTKLLTAISDVNANTPYHLKIVIADRDNVSSDSALFIAANSMNIGQQILGADKRISNGLAFCDGENHTLDTGLSSSQYTFSWKKNTLALPDSGSSIVIAQPGTYEVTATTTGACQQITDSVVVEFKNCSLGIPENIKLENAGIYPNPNSGEFTFRYKLANTNPVSATVTNVLGQIIQTIKTLGMEGENTLIISLQNQPKGIYFVTATSEGKSVTKKVIAQ